MRLIKMPTICFVLYGFSFAFGGMVGCNLAFKQWATAIIAYCFAFILQCISYLIHNKYERDSKKLTGVC